MKNLFQVITSIFNTLIFFFIGLIVPPFFLVSGRAADIADIKKEYAHIRNYLFEYKAVKREQTAESAEGGTLTACFDDTCVRLISEELMGETGKRITEYYYSNLNLFFVYGAAFTYNRPIYMDSAFAVSSEDNERHDPSKTQETGKIFYFNNQPLIPWQDRNQKSMNQKSELSKNKKKEWIVSRVT